jgi:two-component system phosphate regulon sensor histidine kinase PhoR
MIYAVHTIYFQKKTAEIIEDNQMHIVHNLRNQHVYFGKALSRIQEDKTTNLQQYLPVMKQMNRRIEFLLDKMLITTIDKTKLSFHPEHVCLHAFIDEIVNEYKQEQEAFTFRFECDDCLVTAYIDSTHFKYALINLIENAVKYSTHNPEICIGCHVNENIAYIVVKDHGIGIPPTLLHKVFERNYRVQDQNSLSQKGFGLGLSYVKLVAEAHGGEVVVESEYKKGSTFTLLIPTSNN